VKDDEGRRREERGGECGGERRDWHPSIANFCIGIHTWLFRLVEFDSNLLSKMATNL
jgi:hypothetical protein